MALGRIAEAAGTGEIVRVRYTGGTQPGSVRDLQPMSVNGETFRALCLSTHAVKTFRFDRCEPVADDVPITYVAGRIAPPVFRTIDEFAAFIVPHVESAGMVAVRTPLDVSAHELRKDGRPRKAWRCRIGISESAWRPWFVSSSRVRSYATLDKAAASFIKDLRLPVQMPLPDLSQSVPARARPSLIVRALRWLWWR